MLLANDAASAITELPVITACPHERVTEDVLLGLTTETAIFEVSTSTLWNTMTSAAERSR